MVGEASGVMFFMFESGDEVYVCVGKCVRRRRLLSVMKAKADYGRIEVKLEDQGRAQDAAD